MPGTSAEESDLRVEPATGPDAIEIARRLMCEYRDSIATSLCYQNFDDEMLTLPGRYAPPAGRILLAWHGAEPVGVVALREIDPSAHGRTCEMKRLYVRPAHRGRGVGRAMCETLLREARAVGYRAMRLDTSGDMLAAQWLYEALGFTRIPRYNDDPLEDTLFFEKVLSGPAETGGAGCARE